jgi:high affinity Mn2+ porin
MFGRRLWEGAEAWISPEIDQGFGLDNTVGLAGFSSGEAYKVGRNAPYLKLPRVFIRQTINSDEATESIAAGPTQLAGLRSADYWVLTVGKFSVPDIFDVNQYAHDPKVDFLNWTAIDAGTFDYAADAWAYTVGAALERYTGPWTARLGLFDLSTVPNSTHLDPGGHEFQMIAELERRHHIGGQPGKTLVTVYDSRGRMGRLQDAITLALQTNSAPDIAKVRQYRSRTGISLSLEQAIDTNLAVFVRAGKAGGNVEAYEFTDVDRTLSAGLSLKGARWSREADTIGLAAVANGISGVREAYLNAGGLGILAGDGRLPHPGAEQILESYYSCEVRSGVWLTFDYQHITNPAYNRDRGPASVFALRAHAAF